jgi:hypothetical protein
MEPMNMRLVWVLRLVVSPEGRGHRVCCRVGGSLRPGRIGPSRCDEGDHLAFDSLQKILSMGFYVPVLLEREFFFLFDSFRGFLARWVHVKRHLFDTMIVLFLFPFCRYGPSFHLPIIVDSGFASESLIFGNFDFCLSSCIVAHACAMACI